MAELLAPIYRCSQGHRSSVTRGFDAENRSCYFCGKRTIIEKEVKLPNLNEMMEDLDESIQNGMKVLVADALDIVAEEYESEPEANYSGVEVGAGLRGYGTRIREDATAT